MSPDRSEGDSIGDYLSVIVMVEVIGMLFYLVFTAEEELNRLTSGGITPGRVLEFFLSSPDRILVAAGLAVLAVVMVKTDAGSLPGDGGA